jgi:hypothetical protein
LVPIRLLLMKKVPCMAWAERIARVWYSVAVPSSKVSETIVCAAEARAGAARATRARIRARHAVWIPRRARDLGWLADVSAGIASVMTVLGYPAG